MKLEFANNKLKKIATNERFGKKVLGELRYSIFMTRLADMAAATTMEDLRYVPGKFHSLSGNRNGQMACHLDEPYRLIFESATDEKNDWSKITIVEIIEIVNYHGK